MIIILDSPAYPKSESLIIPANKIGIMNNGTPAKIIKDGWKVISEEAKQVANNNQPDVGEYFVTGPGRLVRRGLKKIYHAIIKPLPSDYTSITIVRKALKNTLKGVIKDKMSSVSICGLGIEPGELDKRSVARLTVEVATLFVDRIDIKIVDNNKEFIDEVKEMIL